MKTLFSSLARTISALVVIISFSLALVWFFLTRHTSGEPAYQVSAAQIVSEFREDEVAATVKYLDKVVEVTGPFTTSGVSGGEAWVIIGGNISLRGAGGVQCFFRDPADAASVPKTRTVTLKGIPIGKLFYVQMNNCKIIWHPRN